MSGTELAYGGTRRRGRRLHLDDDADPRCSGAEFESDGDATRAVRHRFLDHDSLSACRHDHLPASFSDVCVTSQALALALTSGQSWKWGKLLVHMREILKQKRFTQVIIPCLHKPSYNTYAGHHRILRQVTIEYLRQGSHAKIVIKRAVRT
eukprot:2554507-Rhodomonas_salina.1